MTDDLIERLRAYITQREKIRDGGITITECNGVPLTDLGEELDVATLFPGVLPIPREEDGALVAEVLWVDRYGNAQLNVDPEELDELGDGVDHFELVIDGARRAVRRVTAFDQIAEGAVALVVDSYGLIALAARQGSAALDLRIDAGDAVTIRPGAGADTTTVVAQAVSVTFSRRSSGVDDTSGVQERQP